MPVVTPDNPAEQIIRRFDSAVSLRGNWENHWEEIAERVLPNYAGSFTGQGMNRAEGTKRTEDMVDATAALALPKFASVMESMLTPRTSRWHSHHHLSLSFIGPPLPSASREPLVRAAIKYSSGSAFEVAELLSQGVVA